MKPSTLLLGILLLASVLRLYMLGSNPPSLDWDEASLGYNAYSILKTGADEYGNFLPFSIRSFNDFKPPLYTYLTIPFVAFLGLTEIAVRLPSALAGISAVLGVYLLTKEVFIRSKHRQSLALTSSFLLAISPWHLQFSRTAFEANLSLAFYIIAVTFFLKWINSTTNSPPTSALSLPKTLSISKFKSGVLWYRSIKSTILIITAITASLALYSYHSARVVVPFTFLGLAILFRNKLLNQKKVLLAPVLVTLVLLAPLLFITLRGGIQQRFNTVSIFTNPGEFSRERERLNRINIFQQADPTIQNLLHHPFTAYGKIIIRNYLEHLNFDFLFLKGDGNSRHSVPGMGLLYLTEAPLLLYGAHKLASSSDKHKYIIWLWLFAGPIAASTTADTPHTVRSILMLPSLQIITSYGIIKALNSNFKLKKPFTVLTSLIFLINIIFYLNLYYVIYPAKFSQDWQYGYKQLVNKVNSLQPDFDKVIVTNKWDQPHIFFAFYNQIQPSSYQDFAETAHQGFGKLTFKQIDFLQDSQTPNSLIVADPQHSPKDKKPLDQIKFLNGDVAYNLYKSN